MSDYLVLTVVVKGENVMGNPLLQATGVASVKGKSRWIDICTPITSIPRFIAVFQGILAGEKEPEAL